MDFIDLNNIEYEEMEVEDITQSEDFTVDIEVEDVHHYILEGGVISHNTISLIAETSSGIEPLMFKSYKRNDRVGERIYIHPKYKQLLLTGNTIPKWFVDMTDLTPKEHLETQAIIQKYVDGAVSKTISMPKGTTPDQLSELLLEYIRELKGTTVYVDGSREGQIYNSLTEEEALEFIMSEMVSNNLSIEDVECNCQKAKDENGEEIEACEITKKVE